MKSRAPTGSCMLLTHSLGAIALLLLTAELIHGLRDSIQIVKLNQKKMYFFPKSKAECFLVLKLNKILWYVDLDDMVILKITLHYMPI